MLTDAVYRAGHRRARRPRATVRDRMRSGLAGARRCPTSDRPEALEAACLCTPTCGYGRSAASNELQSTRPLPASPPQPTPPAQLTPMQRPPPPLASGPASRPISGHLGARLPRSPRSGDKRPGRGWDRAGKWPAAVPPARAPQARARARHGHRGREDARPSHPSRPPAASQTPRRRQRPIRPGRGVLEVDGTGSSSAWSARLPAARPALLTGEPCPGCSPTRRSPARRSPTRRSRANPTGRRPHGSRFGC